jgi:hypothetical protein
MARGSLWQIDMATAPGLCAAWPAVWPCTAATSAPPTGCSPVIAVNPSSLWAAAGAADPPDRPDDPVGRRDPGPRRLDGRAAHRQPSPSS